MAVTVQDNRTVIDNIVTFGDLKDYDNTIVQEGDPNVVKMEVTGLLPFSDSARLIFRDSDGYIIGGRRWGKYWTKNYEQRKQVWLNYK